MNDIISRWKDEKTLPSDADEELKKNSVIVLDQLKIVRDIHRSRAQKVDNPKPGPSKERPPELHEFPNTAENKSKQNLNFLFLHPSLKYCQYNVIFILCILLQESEVCSVSEDNTKDNPVNEKHSSRSPNPNADKVARMMHEATKHHGDVQAKLDAGAPYNFFLTSVCDSPPTHKEHLTITFTGITRYCILC